MKDILIGLEHMEEPTTAQMVAFPENYSFILDRWGIWGPTTTYV